MTARTRGTRSDPAFADLLADVAAGDQDAFARFYDATAPRVVGLAGRILRDHAQGEEVAQEVYLTAWRDAARFDPRRGSALTWLLTITHRKAVDRVRSSEASRRREAAHDRMAAPLRDELDDPREDHGPQVRAALAQLSPIQRQAVQLAFFEGLTHVEVGAALAIPLGTAKSRIRDGLLRLRQVLVVEPQGV